MGGLANVSVTLPLPVVVEGVIVLAGVACYASYLKGKNSQLTQRLNEMESRLASLTSSKEK